MSARKSQTTAETVTLSLSWRLYDPPGKPWHRVWTLCGSGVFELAEVIKSMAGWGYQITDGDPCDGAMHHSGFASLEDAQAACIVAVKELTHAN